MATLINASIDLKKIDKTKIKDGQYLYVSISVNDETKFNNNVGIFIAQPKEERDVERQYIGNGRVVWTDNVITLAAPIEESETSKSTSSSKVSKKQKEEQLPF